MLSASAALGFFKRQRVERLREITLPLASASLAQVHSVDTKT